MRLTGCLQFEEEANALGAERVECDENIVQEADDEWF